MNHRRDFLMKAGLISVALPVFGPALSYSIMNVNSQPPQICYFTKHLQWLDFDELGAVLKEAGFNGADLTIRTGGHVEPAEAASELPKAVKTLSKYDITVPMAVTRVADPRESGLDNFLKTMADTGVQYYRMGYLQYDYTISIPKNIERFRKILGELAAKNQRYNICGVYQNHAGNRLGASIWDLYLSLEGIDPDFLGCQFDIRHATYEGGRSWENDLRVIKDHIRTTVVKDFHWIQKNDGTWTNNNVLMGHGMVEFKKYFQLCHELKISGPISNHSEYPLIKKEEQNLSKSEKMKIAIGRLKQDVDYTKSFLNQYE